MIKMLYGCGIGKSVIYECYSLHRMGKFILDLGSIYVGRCFDVDNKKTSKASSRLDALISWFGRKETDGIEG